jgi:hypothetical protein
MAWLSATQRACLALLALLLGAVLITGIGGRTANAASATDDPRYFPQTGYHIDTDAFYDYFTHRGGVRTFGYPTSQTFTLLGYQVQFFQRQVMQQRADGTVTLLNVLDPGILPYTHFNGSTFPGVDPALTAGAPTPSDPNYATDASAFVAAHAPDTVAGKSVNFHATFLAAVSAADAFPTGPANTALLPLLDLEIWGFPTSAPTADPANGNFIYLRFQRGIMQYDATTGLTQGVLLADYLKATIIGQPLPPDLLQEAAGSPYFQQWAPSQPNFLARPGELPNTNLTNAFYQQDAAGHTLVPTATPTPLPTATPIGDYCIGDEKMTFAGAGGANIGDVVYITVTSARNHSNVIITGPDAPTFVKQYAGQEGQVWEYQVTIKTAGPHSYTWYVDTTTVCTANNFDIATPTATATVTIAGTATPTATASPAPTATPTVGPKPSISGVNPMSFVSGQVITINGGPFGSPPPGSGASGTNGTVFFFFQSGPTPGPTLPTPTPMTGATSGQASVTNWTNGFISVQVPVLAPSSSTNGSYCIQVTVLGAPPSDPACGLQLSGS